MSPHPNLLCRGPEFVSQGLLLASEVGLGLIATLACAAWEITPGLKTHMFSSTNLIHLAALLQGMAEE